MVGGFGLSSWAASGGDQVSGYFSFIDFFFFFVLDFIKVSVRLYLEFCCGFCGFGFFLFFFFFTLFGFFRNFGLRCSMISFEHVIG